MFQVRYLLAGGNRQTDFQIAAMISYPAPDRAAPGSMVNNAFSKRANARAFMAERRKLYPNDNYYIVDLRSEKTKRSYAEGEVQYTVEYKRVKYSGGNRVDTKYVTDPISHPSPWTQYVKTRAEGRALLKAANEANVSGAYKFRLVRKVVTTA